MYDALVTGGIPLVPNSMVLSFGVLMIPTDWYETYGPNEINSPKSFLTNWITNRKKLTLSEQLERVSKAIRDFHIDSIIEQLVRQSLCEINLESSTSDKSNKIVQI